MNMHRSLVARITCLNIVISIAALPFGLSLVNSAIDQGVDIIYDHMGTYQDGFRGEEESGFFEPFDEFDPNIQIEPPPPETYPYVEPPPENHTHYEEHHKDHFTEMNPWGGDWSNKTQKDDVDYITDPQDIPETFNDTIEETVVEEP